jgi:hypothetical protein
MRTEQKKQQNLPLRLQKALLYSSCLLPFEEKSEQTLPGTVSEQTVNRTKRQETRPTIEDNGDHYLYYIELHE